MHQNLLNAEVASVGCLNTNRVELKDRGFF